MMLMILATGKSMVSQETAESGMASFLRQSENGRAQFSFVALQPGWKEIWTTHPVTPQSTQSALYEDREGVA